MINKALSKEKAQGKINKFEVAQVRTTDYTGNPLSILTGLLYTAESNACWQMLWVSHTRAKKVHPKTIVPVILVPDHSRK